MEVPGRSGRASLASCRGERSEPAGLVRMTEPPAPVPMPLTDAADAYFVARSPRKDSAHTTARPASVTLGSDLLE